MEILQAKKFDSISGDIVHLRLVDVFNGNKRRLPYYQWLILETSTSAEVGDIRLSIGLNDTYYYIGNVGYEIAPMYRGHHYAAEACKLVADVARYHGMDNLIFSCESENIASRKTIERLNAVLIEEAIPSKDYRYYYDGMSKYCIYSLTL